MGRQSEIKTKEKNHEIETQHVTTWTRVRVAAPAAKSNLNVVVWLSLAAWLRGVVPRLLRVLTSAPAASNTRTHPGCSTASCSGVWPSSVLRCGKFTTKHNKVLRHSVSVYQTKQAIGWNRSRDLFQPIVYFVWYTFTLRLNNSYIKMKLIFLNVFFLPTFFKINFFFLIFQIYMIDRQSAE